MNLYYTGRSIVASLKTTTSLWLVGQANDGFPLLNSYT